MKFIIYPLAFLAAIYVCARLHLVYLTIRLWRVKRQTRLLWARHERLQNQLKRALEKLSTQIHPTPNTRPADAMGHLKCQQCRRFIKAGLMTAPIWEMTLHPNEWCQCEKPVPWHRNLSRPTQPNKSSCSKP